MGSGWLVPDCLLNAKGKRQGELSKIKSLKTILGWVKNTGKKEYIMLFPPGWFIWRFIIWT